MSDKINKTSLEKAKADFEEIKKFALNESKKELEKEVSKKVVELMETKLDEGESSKEDKDIVQEEVTINADGTTITIDNDGNVDIDAEGEMEMGGSNDSMLGEPADVSDIESIEAGGEDEEEIIAVSDEEDEIEIDKSELEEMIDEKNFEEQEVAAPAPATEPAAEAPIDAPAEEPAMEEPGMEEPMEDEIANPFAELGQKLDTLIDLMGGQAGAEGGEEIEIVDDAGDAPAEPAPAPAPAAEPEAPVAEEITFEVVNDMEVPEMDASSDVLEIMDEDDDDMEDMDDMDENRMSGHGHAVRRAAGNQDDAHGNTSPEVASKRKRKISESKENKAQYEAKIAELIKENESLKAEVKENEEELVKFENGFIKLQENFGQMQDHVAKLQMAYKVAMSGGLTTDEKVQISEQFDKCETVKDAENLYKSIVKEHKIKVNKNPEKSIKSSTIKSAPKGNSISQPLYESREVKRMKELAGIKKS